MVKHFGCGMGAVKNPLPPNSEDRVVGSDYLYVKSKTPKIMLHRTRYNFRSAPGRTYITLLRLALRRDTDVVFPHLRE
jgi:hypothetical protein